MVTHLYNLLIVLLAAYLFANIYAFRQFRKYQHHWGPLADSYLGNAILAICLLLTTRFGPRPVTIVWWALIVALVGRIGMTAGMARPTLFLLGWYKIKGGAAQKGDQAGMIEEPQQIAADIERLEKAMDAMGQDLAEQPFDSNHVRTRLGDFSTVLSGLRQRVLALPNQQPLTAADAPQEKQNEN